MVGIGKPDLFGTFSCAERTWDEVAAQIFETIPKEEKLSLYKSFNLDDLSTSMKEKMIADNFILMSHHFHRYNFDKICIHQGFKIAEIVFFVKF